MKHRKSENRTQQQKQQPTTVTVLMLICRGDTHPNQGFWTKLRPLGLFGCVSPRHIIINNHLKRQSMIIALWWEVDSMLTYDH